MSNEIAKESKDERHISCLVCPKIVFKESFPATELLSVATDLHSAVARRNFPVMRRLLSDLMAFERIIQHDVLIRDLLRCIGEFDVFVVSTSCILLRRIVKTFPDSCDIIASDNGFSNILSHIKLNSDIEVLECCFDILEIGVGYEEFMRHLRQESSSGWLSTYFAMTTLKDAYRVYHFSRWLPICVVVYPLMSNNVITAGNYLLRVSSKHEYESLWASIRGNVLTTYCLLAKRDPSILIPKGLKAVVRVLERALPDHELMALQVIKKCLNVQESHFSKCAEVLNIEDILKTIHRGHTDTQKCAIGVLNKLVRRGGDIFRDSYLHQIVDSVFLIFQDGSYETKIRTIDFIYALVLNWRGDPQSLSDLVVHCLDIIDPVLLEFQNEMKPLLALINRMCLIDESIQERITNLQ